MADILSQDELDALLSEMGTDDDDDDDDFDFGPGAPPSSPAMAIEPEPAQSRPTSGGFSPPPPPETDNVDVILNLQVQLQVELGRATLSIGELLQLGQGAVVELDHTNTDDLLRLTINGQSIAVGEAVAVPDSENYHLRVVEIDELQDRIRKI